MEYTRLTDFGGKAKYDGIEWDVNVPKENMISSPGGTASTFHHWTKGFYGKGGSSTDKFGNSDPYYVEGIYGDLYNKSDSEAKLFNKTKTIDKKYWNNRTDLDVSSVELDRKFNDNGYTTEYFNGETKVRDIDSNVEEVIKEMCPCKAKPGYVSVTLNPWVIFIIFLVAYMAIDMWASAGKGLIKDHLHGGKEFKTMDMIFYAVIITVVLIVLARLTSTPVSSFETL